jgi:hypothetical protein
MENKAENQTVLVSSFAVSLSSVLIIKLLSGPYRRHSQRTEQFQYQHLKKFLTQRKFNKILRRKKPGEQGREPNNVNVTFSISPCSFLNIELLSRASGRPSQGRETEN